MVFVTYLTNVPNCIITALENIQKEFLWDGKRPKVKHSALINSYEQGGLKSIDIKCKIKSLQLSWVKRLFDDSCQDWKIIPK